MTPKHRLRKKCNTCGGTKCWLTPKWFNSLRKARWICAAKGCPTHTPRRVAYT